MHDVPGLQIDQDRAKAAPAQEGKVVDAKKEDRFGGEIRQSHDAAQDRLTGGPYAQAGGEAGSPFAARCQSNGADLLTVPDRHSGERLDKVGEPLGMSSLK